MRKKLFLFLLCGLFASTFMTFAQDTPTDPNLKWWNDRVFYEIFVRSFQDSDGDGIGDFQGLISRLDYLNDGDPTTKNDLGVTGIWLMPIMPSPTYHGYDVTDYYGINPEYGTLADFELFIEEAHKRGIAVIIDMVINHTADDHPWFQASKAGDEKYSSWYVWEDENPNFKGPDGQTVWHTANDRFYYGLFEGGMPDLNYENPEVTAEMYEIGRFWLEDIGVDGFRLDAAKFIIAEGTAQSNTRSTRDWLTAYRDYLRTVKPDVLILAEIWDSVYEVAQYIPESVDVAFEFDLARSLVRGASLGVPSGTLEALNNMLTNYPFGQYATFITNHDQNRVMSEVQNDIDAAKVASSVLLTFPGIPFLYYGEEIGMVGVKPDPDIRTPMQWESSANGGFTTGTPWRPVNADVLEGVNVAAQKLDLSSLFNHYKSLIQLRNNHEALRLGNLTLIEETGVNGVIAFIRHTENEQILVIINMRPRNSDTYAISVDSSILNPASQMTVLYGDSSAIAPTFNEAGGFTDYKPLAVLPARSTLILQFTP
ncbi:MAG: alpha-amylase family glycosyl hydrolase [bacterium]|nr:alpha-amylase family glycosyl hydrolase [bacterium]